MPLPYIMFAYACGGMNAKIGEMLKKGEAALAIYCI